MNKKLITSIIIACVILIFILTIFFREKDYSNISIEPDDIMNNIMTKLNSDIPSMIQLDEEEVENKYNIDILKIENYSIRVPMMNIRSDEIAIIKVKDIKDIDYVKNKFNERIKAIQDTFEEYLEDQYELAKNPLLVSKGKYVLMSISDKNDDIVKIFDDCFVVNK
jgi:hypothetical protein